MYEGYKLEMFDDYIYMDVEISYNGTYNKSKTML